MHLKIALLEKGNGLHEIHVHSEISFQKKGLAVFFNKGKHLIFEIVRLFEVTLMSTVFQYV